MERSCSRLCVKRAAWPAALTAFTTACSLSTSATLGKVCRQPLLPLQPEPALSTVALQHLPPVSQQTCQGSSQLAPVRLIHSAERGLEAQEAQLPQLCQRGHHTVM